MSRVPVPWVNGAVVEAGMLDAPAPAVTVADRCAVKRQQIAEDIATLESHLEGASDDRSRAWLGEQLAFQRQRATWLYALAQMTPKTIDALAQEVRAQVGPNGVLALRDGLTGSLPAETQQRLAHLALVNYAQGVDL